MKMKRRLICVATILYIISIIGMIWASRAEEFIIAGVFALIATLEALASLIVSNSEEKGGEMR